MKITYAWGSQRKMAGAMKSTATTHTQLAYFSRDISGEQNKVHQASK